jgi:hypothetical protein
MPSRYLTRFSRLARPVSVRKRQPVGVGGLPPDIKERECCVSLRVPTGWQVVAGYQRDSDKAASMDISTFARIFPGQLLAKRFCASYVWNTICARFNRGTMKLGPRGSQGT